MKFFLALVMLSASAYSATKEDLRRKERLVCQDIISYVSIYPLPADPDVNLIWNFALNACLSKVALQARLGSEREPQKTQLKAELEELDKLVTAVLYAVRLSFFVFMPPYNLRLRLVELYKKTKVKDSGVMQ